MARKYRKKIISCWIFMVVATLENVLQSCVESLRTLDRTNLGPELKGTIKTIEVPEDGDKIDCVDIYKQPAFDNLSIKELKMVPRSFPNAFNKTSGREPKLIQTWTKYGECPEGTIPIRRTWNDNGTIHRKVYDDQNIHEYASVVHYANKGRGGKAIFNLWKPRVVALHEFSLSQLWITAGRGRKQTFIEAGWMVHPELFHDSQTRLFIYWTRDYYRRTGCYNLICSGFVQTNNKVTLGASLEPASVYDGKPVAIDISFVKSQDADGGDWWLIANQEVVGYFPHTLLPTLDEGADSIAFGGEIINRQSSHRHTSTTMGSGRFSSRGFRRACFISQIQVADNAYSWVEPNLEIQVVSRPTCYDLTFGPPDTPMGSHFYFGGPGLSPHCQ